MSSFKSKEAAEAKAKNMLEEAEAIGETGWKALVWENLGWHCKIFKGAMSVYSACNGKYHAMMSDNPNDHSYGSPAWNDKTFLSENLGAVITFKIDECLDRVQELLNAVKSVRCA